MIKLNRKRWKQYKTLERYSPVTISCDHISLYWCSWRSMMSCYLIPSILFWWYLRGNSSHSKDQLSWWNHPNTPWPFCYTTNTAKTQFHTIPNDQKIAILLCRGGNYPTEVCLSRHCFHNGDWCCLFWSKISLIQITLQSQSYGRTITSSIQNWNPPWWNNHTNAIYMLRSWLIKPSLQESKILYTIRWT